jgi:hypothetical protein
MKKVQIFLLYTIISFFIFLVIIFFNPASKKIITVYEIGNNFNESKIDINSFEDFFDFNLVNNKKNKSEFEDFYTHVILNHNDKLYKNGFGMLVNYYELFNKSLKKKLEINSFNSQANLKSYSYKNIPQKIYEVKIISNNPEDAQKFFEKYIKEVANEVNMEIVNQLYIDFLSNKIKSTKLDLINFNKCRNIANSELQNLLKTDSNLSAKCEYIYNLTLLDNKIKDLENSYILNNAKIKNFKSLNNFKLTDFFYRNFIKIEKKENIDNINSLNAFILYLFLLIFVSILIFKTNYPTLLFKSKLFKFPK